MKCKNEQVEFLQDAANSPFEDFFMSEQNTFLFLLQTILYEPYFFIRFDASFWGDFLQLPKNLRRRLYRFKL